MLNGGEEGGIGNLGLGRSAVPIAMGSIRISALFVPLERDPNFQIETLLDWELDK
jgi:hypothetical protein